MKRLVQLISASACATILSGTLLHAAEEWTDLLEGNDFKEHWETTGNWSISDGAVTLTPRPGEGGWSRWTAYLWSKEEYKDFEIEFEYRVQPRGNSGFYFHVGDKNNPVAQGIEVQLYDSHGKPPNAKLTDHDSGGIIPGLPPVRNSAKVSGEWNKMEVMCANGAVVVKLNGEIVNLLSLNHPRITDRPEAGYIGFQDHALPLSLRKIKIRKL